MSASHSRDFFGRAAADNNNNLSHMPDSFASQQIMVLDFRNGSKADIELAPVDVRFTPESGHRATASITTAARLRGAFSCL
jgi:hypothetical protein